MVDIIPRKGLLFLDIIIKQLAVTYSRYMMLLTGSESGGQLRNREEQPRIVRNAGEHADVRWGAHTLFFFLFFPLFLFLSPSRYYIHII